MASYPYPIPQATLGYARGQIAASFLTQTLMLALTLLIGAKRFGNSYEIELIRTCFWILSLTFLGAQLWLLFHVLRNRSIRSTAILKQYTAYGQRFVVICGTLSLVFGALARV